MSEVDDVVTRLKILEETIIDPVSGSTIVAYADVPYSINVGDMPLVVNFVGTLSGNETEGSDETGREMIETRNYNVVLYHSPYMAGIEGEKLSLLRPYFKLFYILFGAYHHLNNLNGIVDAVLIGDGGMGTVQFNGQAYFGIRFTLRVMSRVRRQFAPGE